MRALFDWLVRHEKSIAAVFALLIIALLVQLKFFKRPDESKTRAARERAPEARTSGRTVATENVAGRWEMQVQKRKSGVQTWTLTLRQSGEALEGVINSEGGDLPVSGTIRGTALKLSAKRFGATVEFNATADGDTMSGRMKVLTVDRAWTAKRV